MININPDLFKRYVSGKCNPEEKELVERWLETGEDGIDPQVFENINKFKLQQEIWQNITPTQEPERKIFTLNLFYKIASCMLLFGLAGYIGVKFKYAENKQPVTTTISYKELAVAKGQKAKITIGDGTVIYLNGDSRLRYPETFDGPNREVYLSGEAHFSVAKIPSKPFLVHTAQTKTRVLGTIFNIKAYPEDARTVVTVEEGKVKFNIRSDPEKHLILTAGEQGIQDHKGGTILKHNVYSVRYSAWKDAKMVISNVPLKEISLMLSRWYGVSVDIKDKDLNNKLFTGTYRQPTIHAVAHDISQALHCKYKVSSANLTFYK